MSDYDQFNELFTRAASTSKREGKYLSQLSAETQSLLGEFSSWCRDNGISEATSRSYKTYVAKALAEPETKLTSDQRSGVKKFQEFMAERG